MTGVVSLNSGVAAFSAGPKAWANGSRPRSAIVLWLANAWALPSETVVSWSVGGSRVSACSRFWDCEEMAAKFVFDELISEVSAPST
jgi:hypothetical protein